MNPLRIDEGLRSKFHSDADFEWFVSLLTSPTSFVVQNGEDSRVVTVSRPEDAKSLVAARMLQRLLTDPDLTSRIQRRIDGGQGELIPLEAPGVSEGEV